jgi:hypothetical protein
MNPMKKTKLEGKTDWNNLITCELSTLKSTLNQYGVAILPAVLMENEQEILGDGIKNHFLNICPELNLKDPKTWKLQLQGLFLSRGMLCQHFNSGHIKEIWDLRANPKIMKAYETLYSGEDLIVSYDGCAFSLPPEYTGIGWHRKKWLHVDQTWTRDRHDGKPTFQSWVTALEVGEGDGTLQVLLGSHKYHAQLGNRLLQAGISPSRQDWYKISESDTEWLTLQRGCILHEIKCPAGSHVIWSSKTVHAGRGPVKGRPHPKLRIAAYICYTPKAWITEKGIKLKQKYLRDKRNTTHWPHHPKVVGKKPNTYGKFLHPCPAFVPYKLSDVQLSLASSMTNPWFK